MRHDPRSTDARTVSHIAPSLPGTRAADVSLENDALQGPRQSETGAKWCGRLAMASLIVTMVLGSAEPARADKYAAEFLKLGVGARALGMGGAFVAIADDATAAFWNPAGLGRSDTGELLFMHSEHFGNLANHDYLGYVQPLDTSTRSAVGIGLIRFAVDDIIVTRDAFEDLNDSGEWEPGEPILTDRFTSDSDVEYGLLLSYARGLSDRLLLGGNLKLLRQGLLDNTAFGMGLDIGMLYDVSEQLTAGLRIADLTDTQLSWDTGRRESVDRSVALGLQWHRRIDSLRGSVVAAGDVNWLDGRDETSQIGSGFDSQGGFEYWYSDMVAARVGSDAGNFTAGAGFLLSGVMRGLAVDYAFLAHDELDDAHRVSASVKF